MVVKSLINLTTKYANNIVELGVRKWTKPTSIEGLRFAPQVSGDLIQISQKAVSTLDKLIKMGYSKENAEKLLKHFSFEECSSNADKSEVLESLFQTICGKRELQQLTYGIRPQYSNLFNYVSKEIQDVDIMSLSAKIRARNMHERGLISKIPESLNLSAHELTEITALKKGFIDMPPISSYAVHYRGERYSPNHPYLKVLQGLKEGESFKIPGYSWTTDDMGYGIGYAFGTEGTNQTSVIYSMLLNPKSKVALSKSRKGQEFFLDNDTQFKLVEKISDPYSNKLYLLVENIVT